MEEAAHELLAYVSLDWVNIAEQEQTGMLRTEALPSLQRPVFPEKMIKTENEKKGATKGERERKRV